MNILCFDTSNNSCSVTISHGQDILAFRQDSRPSMQAENLLPLIECALQDAKLNYQELDYIAVTTGPGSFTGIRIGLAAAQGIAHAQNLKLVGINNFETSYYRLKQQYTNFDKAYVIINAYRNQLYVQEFEGNIRNKPILTEPDKITERLQNEKGRIVCGGNGLGLIYQQLKDVTNITLLPRFPKIHSYHIARLAHEMILSKNTPPAEPLYIRPPDAVPQL